MFTDVTPISAWAPPRHPVKVSITSSTRVRWDQGTSASPHTSRLMYHFIAPFHYLGLRQGTARMNLHIQPKPSRKYVSSIRKRNTRTSAQSSAEILRNLNSSHTRMGEHNLLGKEDGQLLKFLATSLSTLRCLMFSKSSAPLRSILEICVYLAHISLSDLQCPIVSRAGPVIDLTERRTLRAQFYVIRTLPTIAAGSQGA